MAVPFSVAVQDARAPTKAVTTTIFLIILYVSLWVAAAQKLLEEQPVPGWAVFSR
jgi:hypothetical protein